MEEIHRAKSWGWEGVFRDIGVPSLSKSPSQHLDVSTNLEVLQSLKFRGFYEGFSL